MKFLLCDSSTHAEVVDGLIAEMLRDQDGTHCAEWSGVWASSEHFGVLWESPASDLFGLPSDDPLMSVEDEILDENGLSNWSKVPPSQPPESEEM